MHVLFSISEKYWYKNGINRRSKTMRNTGILFICLIFLFSGCSKLEKKYRQLPKEMQQLILAAQGGDVQAQYKVGKIFETGSNGVEKDYSEALLWYGMAAEQNLPQAQYNLGLLYAKGLGTEKRPAVAFEKIKQAAEQGLAEAQFALGFMYSGGIGVEKNEAAAVEWYTKAATQGLAKAQNNLAAMYLKGVGVKQDTVEALKWYILASDGGDEAAKKYRAELFPPIEKMRPELIEQARKLVAQFKPVTN